MQPTNPHAYGFATETTLALSAGLDLYQGIVPDLEKLASDRFKRRTLEALQMRVRPVVKDLTERARYIEVLRFEGVVDGSLEDPRALLPLLRALLDSLVLVLTAEASQEDIASLRVMTNEEMEFRYGQRMEWFQHHQRRALRSVDA